MKQRTVTYTNAGHPAGIVAGPSGTRYLKRGGPPAGLLPGAEFQQELISLHAGDACLFVSDGVTEALEGEAPLERDLVAARPDQRAASAADLCQAVMARARRGHGPVGIQQWEDDRTVVVVTLGRAYSSDPSPSADADRFAADTIGSRTSSLEATLSAH